MRSHKILQKSHSNLLKPSYYPRRKYDAHRRQDIRRSHHKFFLRSSKGLPSIFYHLTIFFIIFLKLKIKTKTKKSLVDSKKI